LALNSSKVLAFWHSEQTSLFFEFLSLMYVPLGLPRKLSDTFFPQIAHFMHRRSELSFKKLLKTKRFLSTNQTLEKGDFFASYDN